MPIHGYPGGVITANPVAPTASVATGVWTTEQQLQAVSQGNWPGYEYPLERSLRFNSADSAYLSRTFGTPTNATTWTLSCWIKRSKFGTARIIMQAGATNTNNGLWSTWNSTDIVGISNSAGSALCTSTAVKRDPSAWSHLVVTNNAGTFTWYENNQNIASGSGTCNINQSGTTHYIGSGSGTNYFFDGYMTEINFIDGQALTPSSFGLNDPETGVWSPKRYTGTYGTNGFYLNFSDNSGTTSTTLGKDYSGNGNNWTPNNFSVTAGAGNDSLVDSPTSYGTDTGVGGEVRGNYCTLNPLQNGGITITNGNLTWAGAGSSAKCATGSIAMTSGKWYFEALITGSSGGNWYSGVCNLSPTLTSAPSSTATGWGLLTGGGGTVLYKSNNNVLTSLSSSSVTGAVVSFAVDVDAGKIWFAQNGTWLEGSPSAGTGASYTNLTGTQIPYVAGYDSNDQGSINFGQRPFAYTAPSGFKALCTQNLPTPTIGATSTTQAGKYFNPVLYTGTGSAQSITGVGFQPDLVWIKGRSFSSLNGVVDAVRGRSKDLYTNLTYAEETSGSTEDLTSFDSDGFSLGTVARFPSNNSGQTFVAWNWKANGAGSSNTAGTITSTVSANTTSGFSIVTYTGNDTSNSTVGHGLGVAPSMIIVKERSQVRDWSVYHISTGNTGGTLLNTTGAVNNTRSGWWSNTSPSASVFTLGGNPQNDWYQTNQTGQTYVAYCFAPVAGYSAFGSYTGNGSTDGPFVYLGFRPRFLLLKISSTTGDWAIYDTSRNTYNVMDLYLYPNSSAAEGGSGTPRVDALSNGFKLRNSGQDNTSSATYIYAAFAESPFKYSLAR